ncbi:C-terminal binding protein [Haloarculaceae archaeon H-GB1-1]|nr:C-terminal binding protein [Haloarculaceae archaeon H-GB1-1]
MAAKIVVTDHGFPSLELETNLTTENGFELEAFELDTEEEVIEHAAGAKALLVHHAPITETVFEEIPSLEAVGRYGTGVDNVDLDAATEHGVQVVNVPAYAGEEVSTHAFALLLSVTRRIPAFGREIAADNWHWSNGIPMQRLRGNTVGFVGFGAIAQRFREKLSGFDFDFVAYDPYQSAEEIAEHGVEKVSFDELVGEAEIVSIHVPLTDETERMFDGDVFERLPDNAILINTARGEIVDLDALYRAIDDGEIYGAGLDVLPEEPPAPEDLREHERLVYTPHTGWYSEGSMTDLRESVTMDVVRVLQDETPENPVNSLAD